MASGLTPIYFIPYPLSTDPVDVHGDIQDLALQLEDILFLKPDKNNPNIFTQPNIFNINSSTDAIRINQTGTGNAFVVEDSANPDTSPFVITAAGDVGIGKTVPTVKLDVTGAGAFSGALTASTFNALTLTAAATGFTIAGGTTSKTLTVSNTLTLAGTDATTMTFPSTSQSIAGLTATQTFTNKSLSDSTTFIVDVTDNTKRLQFDVTGTTGITGIFQTAFTTAKTVAFQDVAGTVYVSTGTDVTLADGGTNASLTAVNGGIVYSTASAMAISAAGSAGQMLQSGGAAAPTWSTATFPSTATTTGTILRANGTNWVATTATYPTTTTANQILYSSAANTIAEITTANNQVLVTNGTGVPSFSGTLPSGVTASSLTSFGTSPTLTTPTIDTINVSGASIAAALWNTTLTTGSISMGGALTTGGVNIANGTAFNGTVAIASGAGTVNKIVNIGTSSTSGTTAVTIGSAAGATSTVTLNGAVSTSGNLTVGGNLTVNGTTTTINSTIVNVDDILIELGSVTTPTDGTAEGGGISLLGATNKTITWSTTGNNWTSSENWNIASSKVYKINNVEVLSSTRVLGITPTINATGFTLSGGTTAVAVTFAGGAAYTVSGTNAQTYTLPSTGGTLALNNQTFFIGTQSIAINQGTGTITSLPGVSSINGATVPTSGTLATNVTTTLGDLIYASANGTPGTLQRLAGNTTAVKQFLVQTGNGTISAAPVWGAIVDGDLPAALTGKSYNGLTLTSTTGTFTLTALKTFTVQNTMTLSSAADGNNLNIGTGGTLGSAAFTASTAYEPAITTLAISKGGTGTGTAPTQWGVIYAASSTAYASTAAGTNTQVLIGNASGAPTWSNISGLSVSSATTATNLSGTTQYSIPYQTSSATTGYVSIGTSGQVLAVNGTTNGYSWISPFTNPMTTLGDIIYGGVSGASTRLAGQTTNGQYFLTENVTASASVAPSWQASTGTAGSNVVLATSPTITTPKIDSIATVAGAGATPTLWSDVTTGSITIGAGITSGTINIATAGSGTNAINIGNANSTLTVNGNLTVNGTTTTVNSVTITVDDPNLELNSVASPTDANANGGGITLRGTTDKSIIWDTTNTNWTANQHFNIPTGKVYKINNTEVLSSTTVLGITPTINATGFALAGGTTSKTLTVQNTLTLAGTDATTMTFPATSGTVATLNTNNIFTTNQTITPSTSVTGLTINAASSAVGLTVKGNLTTPGDIQDWRNGSNTIVGSVKSNGFFNILAIKDPGTTSGILYTAHANGDSILVDTVNANNVGLIIKGVLSQSASLQEWQNSGLSVLAKIDASGNLTANSIIKSGGTSSQYLMADGSVTSGITAAAGTLTGTTLASNVTASSLTSVGVLTSLTVSGTISLSSLSIAGTATFGSTVTVPTPTNNTDAANKAYVDSVLNAGVPEIVPLDDISGEFNGIQSIFVPKYQGIKQSITNPLRLQLTINGIIQYVDFPDYVWQSPLPREGFQINNDGNIAFSEAVPAGSRFDAMIQPGPNTITKKRQYPFKAVDILLGG